VLILCFVFPRPVNDIVHLGGVKSNVHKVSPTLMLILAIG
jgi:hypothetical protein